MAYEGITMGKLESIFLSMLGKKDYRKDDLIAETKKISSVEEYKVENRLKKLIDSGKLYLYNNDMISLNSPFAESETFDERYDYGGITLARKGREVYITSNFEGEKHKEMVEEIKLNLSGFKKEVNQLLVEIENLIIQSFNPLDALGYTSVTNLTFDPEEYTESSFKGKQFFVELLHNIVLKHDFNVFPKESDFTKLDELKELLDKYWNKFNLLIIYELISEDDLSIEEKNVYFYTLSHFLFIRGDVYPQHIKQIAEELFSNFDHVLLKKGFTMEDYFSTVKEIESQINSNLYDISNFLSQTKKEQDAWLKFIKQSEEMGKSVQEIEAEYKQRVPAIREKLLPSYTKFTKIEAYKDIYKIDINEKINKSLLDTLVTNFDSNQNWCSPLDVSSVPLKPIIKVEEKYYCFIEQHLIRNVIHIIESLLPRDEINYSTIKGDYFESKSLALINNILPNAQIYSKLKYPSRKELDGLVISDDNLFLIEVKGKKRRCIACTEDIY